MEEQSRERDIKVAWLQIQYPTYDIILRRRLPIFTTLNLTSFSHSLPLLCFLSLFHSPFFVLLSQRRARANILLLFKAKLATHLHTLDLNIHLLQAVTAHNQQQIAQSPPYTQLDANKKVAEEGRSKRKRRQLMKATSWTTHSVLNFQFGLTSNDSQWQRN